MDQTTETDLLRTKYSLANPETHSTTSNLQETGNGCMCTCRNEQRADRRCENRAEFSHHHHHQINESTSHRLTETNGGLHSVGALGPHRRNTTTKDHRAAVTDSYGILNTSGQCIRQLVKNMSGTYSAYHWSMFLFIHILLLSLHGRPCSASHPSPSSESIDRVSILISWFF